MKKLPWSNWIGDRHTVVIAEPKMEKTTKLKIEKDS